MKDFFEGVVTSHALPVVKNKISNILVLPYVVLKKFMERCKSLGLVALTLDKESVLVVEISETFGKSVPACLREDGKIVVNHKMLAKVIVIIIIVSSYLCCNTLPGHINSFVPSCYL